MSVIGPVVGDKCVIDSLVTWGSNLWTISAKNSSLFVCFSWIVSGVTVHAGGDVYRPSKPFPLKFTPITTNPCGRKAACLETTHTVTGSARTSYSSTKGDITLIESVREWPLLHLKQGDVPHTGDKRISVVSRRVRAPPCTPVCSCVQFAFSSSLQQRRLPPSRPTRGQQIRLGIN